MAHVFVIGAAAGAVGTIVVRVKKKVRGDNDNRKSGGGGDDTAAAAAEAAADSSSSSSLEDEEAILQRRADAAARVAGIEAMLKDMTSKLEDTQAAADEAARKADERDLEGRELRKQLDTVMSEKNAVERMLEEMAKKKDAAEEAACAAETERAKVYDENKNLLDTVTVLTDARAADHAQHAVATPAEFLAEVLSLVRDMDNEVEVELIGADVATQRAGGGSRVANGEELQLCDEWTHNPALAMARPDRLCRLANKTRGLDEAQGGGAVEGAGAGAVSLASAGAGSGHKAGKAGKAVRDGAGGVSGVEMNVATPRVAHKRREALSAVDANVDNATNAVAAADESKPRLQQSTSGPATTTTTADSSLVPHYVEFDSPKTLVSPKKLTRSAADDGLIAVTAADVENAAPPGSRQTTSAHAALKAGFSAKANLDLSSVFGGAATGAKAAAAAASSVAIAAGAAAGVAATGAVAGAGGAQKKTLGDDMDVYHDFADISSPAASRGAIVAGK